MGLSIAIGFGLTLAGWGTARAVAGATRAGRFLVLFHDGLVPLGTFLVLLMAGARPILAGCVAFGAFAGFAFADHVKRQVLREPIVFTDMSEVVALFRHPEFYLPFAGTWRVCLGMAGVAVTYGVLFFAEPPLFAATIPWAALVLAGAVLLILLLARFGARPWARLLRRFNPCGDPVADARRLGPFAMIGTYGIIARAERTERRASARMAGVPLKAKPPVILVQSESFFDARRLGLEPDYLPAFETARSSAVQWGRLDVPCWGANTTRTEFAVLSGLSGDQIGFDRFNPYHAFARGKLPSLARFFRSQGYRTICIHPFDLHFYDRDRIMPLLGFEEIVGQEAFAPAHHIRGYVGDADVARYCAARLTAGRQPVFIFVITMENHGPWASGTGLPAQLAHASDGDGLGEYLAHLKGADAMIAMLTSALAQRGEGMLGFYGDHMPSLPRGFSGLGFAETSTDYFLWRPGGALPARADIAAHDLPAAIIKFLSAPSARPAAQLEQGLAAG
ncbi:MAG TPA: LTA synthase family protein [Rhizomicrobium sp.]|nr:LTA synthase family protein [Rhizomicrobium sp.]